MRSYWIRVGPNPVTGIFKEREIWTQIQTGIRSCNSGGRDCSVMSTSQEEQTIFDKHQKLEERHITDFPSKSTEGTNTYMFYIYLGHVYLGLLASRTMGEYIFVVSSYLVCGNSLRQTLETNMPSQCNNRPIVLLASKHTVSSHHWSLWHPAHCFQGWVSASQRELSPGRGDKNLERRFWD